MNNDQSSNSVVIDIKGTLLRMQEKMDAYIEEDEKQIQKSRTQWRQEHGKTIVGW